MEPLHEHVEHFDDQPALPDLFGARSVSLSDGGYRDTLDLRLDTSNA